MSPATLLERLDPLRREGTVLTTPTGELLHAEAADELGHKLRELLEQFHQANPLRLGIAPDELAALADLRKDLFALALDRLVRSGAVTRQGTVLSLTGHGAQVPAALAGPCQLLERALREAHLEPPLPAELAAKLGLNGRAFEQALRLLADSGQVVMLDPKVVMHRDAVGAAREVVLRLLGAGRTFTTMEYRDALGVSRKFVVPLLDYFDTQRLTVRGGNRRQAGAAAKAALAPPVPPADAGKPTR